MRAIFLLIVVLAAANIEAYGTCDRKIDLLFTLDGSSTICGGTERCPIWDAILEFCKNIVNGLTIGLNDTRVAFVTDYNKSEVNWDLLQYRNKEPLMSAIDNIPYRGGELIDAVSLLAIITRVFNPLKGDRVGVQNIGILITDGAPNYSDEEWAVISKTVQVDGVGVFVVCLTPGCKEHYAAGIASHPHKANETYFLVDDHLLIDQMRDIVVKKFCAYEMIVNKILNIGK